jgi:hypothetical protein
LDKLIKQGTGRIIIAAFASHITRLVKIVEIDTSDGFTRFVDQSGEYWYFVTPYDFIKDEPIFTI